MARSAKSAPRRTRRVRLDGVHCPYPHIEAGTIGEDRPILVLAGRTKGGVRHEIELIVGDNALRNLVVQVRTHFRKRAECEAAHRAWREQPFREAF